MKLCLHPSAAADLRDTAGFYWKQAGTSLAQAFLTDFERASLLLLDYPGLGPPWRLGKRRFFLKRFPYSIIYDTKGRQLRVLAVIHNSRRPEYWRDED